jgi:hypothetical protein
MDCIKIQDAGTESFKSKIYRLGVSVRVGRIQQGAAGRDRDVPRCNARLSLPAWAHQTNLSV